MPNDFDVVIIGGGAAGISAARRLQEKNLSILMIEASSRLGGRAWTVGTKHHALDLGCGWLHSADRNPWMDIARKKRVKIDKKEAAWGLQYRDLGFSAEKQQQARNALASWMKRLPIIARNSDRASDALDVNSPWNAYIQAMCGFSNGVAPNEMSAEDYLTYDAACSYRNWRVPTGMGTLISRSLPSKISLSLSTPVTAISENGHSVQLRTSKGDIRARTAILTCSTSVLSGDAIKLPETLLPWREAASYLPLGQNEKLFLFSRDPVFVPETHVLADPYNAIAVDFYIRPFGWPVIECYLGGDSAKVVQEQGLMAGFDLAIGQLANIFGSHIRSNLKPLSGSNWSRYRFIGGGYSCALPRRAGARRLLAKPWKDKLFFAGEATSPDDYASAHGAYSSGERAAKEVMAVLRKS